MTTKLNRFFALTALVSLAVVSTASMADNQTSSSGSGSSLYVSETGTRDGQILKLVLPIPEGNGSYFTGSLNILTGTSVNSGSISNGTSFLAYCIDPFQWSSASPAAYNNTSLSTLGATRETDVSRLYSQSYAGTSGSGINSAAFQLALWELAKDDGMLTSGEVRSTNHTDSNVVALASSMISNAKNGVAGPNQYSFNLYTSGKKQDYLVASMTSVTPVPEPETYAMLLAGLGLIGFTASRRRASRQA
jgi:hypothetical protein